MNIARWLLKLLQPVRMLLYFRYRHITYLDTYLLCYLFRAFSTGLSLYHEDESTVQQKISMPRYCYECVNKATGARHCLVCGSEEETHLLLCNSCPRAYHTSCLTPPLAKVTLLNRVADPGSSAFLTHGSGIRDG
jgi:hypothetical protein